MSRCGVSGLRGVGRSCRTETESERYEWTVRGTRVGGLRVLTIGVDSGAAASVMIFSCQIQDHWSQLV